MKWCFKNTVLIPPPPSFHIQAVAFFLVGVVIAAQTLSYDFSVSVPIGIAIVAAFLFCVAVMGLVGVLRHQQVVMFFVSFLGNVGVAEIMYIFSY